jgi:hypothetical protein
MNAASILQRAQEYTNKVFKQSKSEQAIVQEIQSDGKIKVLFPWQSTPSEIYYPVLKHVVVATGDRVLMRPLDGSYICEGVITR